MLRRGDFAIDLIWRRVKVQEFLLRYDLSHPLVRAYREGTVCVVNSFRSELAHKKAIFDLLTDEAITASFPTAEKKAIRQYIPWTRVVSASKTVYRTRPCDLPDFILKNREKLVLKPNDESGENHTIRGWETDDAGWDRALKRAMRIPYVVQEKVEAIHAQFPLFRYGETRVSGNEGGSAPARLPRQSAGLFHLAERRQRRLLDGERRSAYVHPRIEIVVRSYRKTPP